MAQTSRSAMATELLHHPTVPRSLLTELQSLLMELQNLLTELLHPPMTPQQPQTATTPQPQTATTLLSQTATTRRQVDTTQAGESVLWSLQLKQGISTPTSTLMSKTCTDLTSPRTTSLFQQRPRLPRASLFSTRPRTRSSSPFWFQSIPGAPYWHIVMCGNHGLR